MKVMEDYGVETTVLLPPPFPSAHPARYGMAELKEIVRPHRDRLALRQAASRCAQALKACAICSAAAWASGTSPRICKKPCTMPLAQM